MPNNREVINNNTCVIQTVGKVYRELDRILIEPMMSIWIDWEK